MPRSRARSKAMRTRRSACLSAFTQRSSAWFTTSSHARSSSTSLGSPPASVPGMWSRRSSGACLESWVRSQAIAKGPSQAIYPRSSRIESWTRSDSTRSRDAMDLSTRSFSRSSRSEAAKPDPPPRPWPLKSGRLLRDRDQLSRALAQAPDRPHREGNQVHGLGRGSWLQLRDGHAAGLLYIPHRPSCS